MSIRRILLIVLAVICGFGTYVLVVVISNHTRETPQVTAQRDGVLEALRADVAPGQPLPDMYQQPTCWNVKTPNLTVGESGDMQLDITTCPPGDLPNEITVQAEPGSAGVTVAGPVHTERSRTGQSWTWRVTGSAAGEHDVSIFVDSVDLIGLSGQIPATIVVQKGADGRKGGVMQVLSSGSMTLNSLAAGLGSVVTSIGTIVALRRSRSKSS